MPNSSLLIIGNGFDLNCGLKTRYKDVYPEYSKSKSDSELISDFKKNINDNFENWSDFEMGMAEYACCLNSEDELIACVNDFNHFLNSYLMRIQHEFHASYEGLLTTNSIIEKMNKSISSLGKEVTHDIDFMIDSRQANSVFNMGIISFNYTDTFEYIYSKAYFNFRHFDVLHIHGLLSDDPVLGVDNEGQLSVGYPITNTSKICFIKPYFNSVFDSRRVSTAKSLIGKSKTIFVYGASLSDSDLTWRNELLNWLQSDSKNHLFLYFYEYTTKQYLTKQDKINIEQNAKIKILNNWKVESIDEMIDRIHVPIGVELFDFAKAIKNDIDASRIIEKNRNTTLGSI